MMKGLLVSPSPTFTLPSCIRCVPAGFFAVTSRGAPALYAAVRGRLITGPLTPFLAELLTGDGGRAAAPSQIAARHGVDAGVLSASLDRLRALGLWSSG